MSQLAWPSKTDVTQTLALARGVLQREASELSQVADRLGETFVHALDMIEQSTGRVLITGVGKSAAIARKIAGTLNSTGTRAYFLDATDAIHGDLGMVDSNDVALVLSHSGFSDEIVRLLPELRRQVDSIIALTGNSKSPVAVAADVTIMYGPIEEACPLAPAPSTSTTVMLALGDALAFALADRRGFTAEQFALNHPAGSLGLRLARAEDLMRTGHDLRIARESDTIREVLARTARHGRRTGAVMLLNQQGQLTGLFTDSDLARLLERRAEHQLDRPISEVMTGDPWSVKTGAKLEEALEILRKNRISELPVLDGDGRPVGMLDVTDLFSTLPVDESDWTHASPKLRRAA